ncbi:hypothetical protein [Bradyrhizobium sp. dw_411]|uniref:hypothetical protein n=1 Tax=Bradyrhizobium sp. dw_411 TaxID=2720082 RepID=UPI001BCE5A4E|nr:hypothetical protein [Bradyrhizobium sp. dw_411]
MDQMSAVRWLAKCAVSAALLLLACGLATALFGNNLQLPATTTRDGTLITLNRYAREPIPDIVFVGSSLTFRLKEEYFTTPRLRNLALAGGSPLTGLEIVANQPRLPMLILIETNVLAKAPDNAVVERYSRRSDAEPLFFRPVRAAVAAYENWLHAPLTHAQVSAGLERLLKEPPSDFDNRIYADRALAQFNVQDSTNVTQANVNRLEQLIAAIERRGSRVLLFELPYSQPLEESQLAKNTRAIVHARFPAPDRWLPIEYARNDLRWADGVHLDERSAVILAQSIDRTLPSLLGSK